MLLLMIAPGHIQHPLPMVTSPARVTPRPTTASFLTTTHPSKATVGTSRALLIYPDALRAPLPWDLHPNLPRKCVSLCGPVGL
jgi:hypothetical protein